MSIRHGLLNLIVRFKVAITQGFKSYLENGCITGAQYLAKPNYHFCERLLWCVIFCVGSCIGSIIIFNYMKDFSQNVFRIVDEPHSPGQPLTYPSLGICQIGEANDEDTLLRLERVLNSTLYKELPELNFNEDLKHVAYMLTFQNMYDKKKLKNFRKFTNTLTLNTQKYLENYNFKSLADQVTNSCEELFLNCSWLGKPFNCCSMFRPISTIVGKCFLFNSVQTEKTMAKETIEQFELYTEPYLLKISISKAAEIFIQNTYDIPQKIFSWNNFLLKKRRQTLSLVFTITPTLIDDSLLDLDTKTLGCTHERAPGGRKNRIYALESFSTCLSEHVYEEQLEICNCININGPQFMGNFCNISHFKCLEQNGFLNTKKILPAGIAKLKLKCLVNCEHSYYSIEEKFYSKITDTDHPHARSLHFSLLHFPTRRKRRQAIRQAEDKLASFSNILGLFMGLNVINIIEFIFLTCCAFWKYDQTTAA